MRIWKQLCGTKFRLDVKFYKYKPTVVKIWEQHKHDVAFPIHLTLGLCRGLVFSNILCLPRNPTPGCRESTWHLTLSLSVNIFLLFLYTGVRTISIHYTLRKLGLLSADFEVWILTQGLNYWHHLHCQSYPESQALLRPSIKSAQ